LFLRFCRRLPLALSVLFPICWMSSTAGAQSLKITIRLLPEFSRVLIEGESSPTTRWSFRDSYAGALGLGNRIEGFVLSDAKSNEVGARRWAPGNLEAERAPSHFKYEVNLRPPINALDAARVSWLAGARGLLILGDLLPNAASNDPRQKAALVRLLKPDGW